MPEPDQPPCKDSLIYTLDEALRILNALEQARKELASPYDSVEFARKLEPLILDIAKTLVERAKIVELPIGFSAEGFPNA